MGGCAYFTKHLMGKIMCFPLLFSLLDKMSTTSSVNGHTCSKMGFTNEFWFQNGLFYVCSEKTDDLAQVNKKQTEFQIFTYLSGPCYGRHGVA